LEVFVRSRWQSHTSKGHFWRPEKTPLIEIIESHQDLLSDYSQSILLWQKYESGGNQTLALFINGIESDYCDSFNRPIKHALLWKGNYDEESDFRKIIYLALRNNLSYKLKAAIFPDKDQGFNYEKAILTKFFNEVTVKTPGSENKEKEFESPAEFCEVLDKCKLYSLSGEWLGLKGDGAWNLSVAIGKGFSLDKLKEQHKFIRWVMDTNKYGGFDGKV